MDSGFRRNDGVVGWALAHRNDCVRWAKAHPTGLYALALLFFCGQDGRALALRGPLGGGERAEEKPEGAARWIAPSSLSAQGCAVSEPRSPLAKSPGRMPGDRRRGGALLFGYFLLGKQEKVTRSRSERKPLRSREAKKAKAKALGPGFRRDDEGGEAFANENQNQNGFRPSPE